MSLLDRMLSADSGERVDKQDDRSKMFEEYEALRAQYREVFGEDAPHCQPLEMHLMAADIRDAIEHGKPLEHPPKGYVT